MPFGIGISVGLGASVAMLFRGSGLGLWVFGVVAMAFFGVFFGLAAFVASGLRRFVARFF
jgi:hypothetical protein